MGPIAEGQPRVGFVAGRAGTRRSPLRYTGAPKGAGRKQSVPGPVQNPEDRTMPLIRHSSLVRACRLPISLFAALAAFGPTAAHAYVGPGAGLTAIGTVLALAAAVLFALVGFIWYPMKRLLKRSSTRTPAAEPTRTGE